MLACRETHPCVFTVNLAILMQKNLFSEPHWKSPKFCFKFKASHSLQGPQHTSIKQMLKWEGSKQCKWLQLQFLVDVQTIIDFGLTLQDSHKIMLVQIDVLLSFCNVVLQEKKAMQVLLSVLPVGRFSLTEDNCCKSFSRW